MYCLTNICHVCLKKKNNLISSVNCSVSVSEELRRITGYLAFNQSWLKTNRIILTCEECYSLLRETYRFLKMWHKNSVLLQGYIDHLNTTTMPNTGNDKVLHVNVEMKQMDINDVKREIKLEDEQIYTFQWEHNIEETDDPLVDFEDSLVKEIIYKKKNVVETAACPTVNYSTEIIEETNDVFVNVEDYFVKQEDTWKREEVDDTEECSTVNNADHTNTDSVSSGFEGKQMHVTNEDDLNTATQESYKCSACSKSFITKTELIVHTRIHADKKSNECDICKMCFNRKANLEIHMRVHTGEKPYKCATCEKCFTIRSILVNHMRTHTGEKPYKCATCKKCFTNRSTLVYHMQTHSDEKPYECATCGKSYILHAHLVRHIRTHTGEKPFECATCKKRFTNRVNLIRHMRTHTGEKPYECVTCKKSFACRTLLVSHMRVHTDEKPYKCSKCNQCFRHKASIKFHLRSKHPDAESH